MPLIDRVRAILMKPRETWPVIAGEPTTAQSIFSGYVVPLAAIPEKKVIAAVDLGRIDTLKKAAE